MMRSTWKLGRGKVFLRAPQTSASCCFIDLWLGTTKGHNLSNY